VVVVVVVVVVLKYWRPTVRTSRRAIGEERGDAFGCKEDKEMKGL
jgi:hypothetical protein